MIDILIDDMRNPGDFRKKIPLDVLVGRDYFQGIQLLKEHQGKVRQLYLDHDLACFRNGREYTGYDVMLFLEEFPEYCPQKLILVTDNPVGRDRMEIVWGAIQCRKEDVK